jgi:GTPase
VLISATTGQRTEKLFESVDRSAKQFGRRISTGVLNEIVNDATLWMAPPTIGTRSGRIYYCIQTSTAPPTVVFFVNDPDLFTDNYQRFLERKIRDALNFEGTPIKMIWRGKAIRDVARQAKKGAVGAITSGVLNTGLGTGTGEGSSNKKKNKTNQ